MKCRGLVSGWEKRSQHINPWRQPSGVRSSGFSLSGFCLQGGVFIHLDRLKPELQTPEFAARRASLIHRLSLRYVFLVVLLAVSLAPVYAEVWYVDKDNAAGPWNGTSWPTAFETVQEGIDAAFNDGGGGACEGKAETHVYVDQANGNNDISTLGTEVHPFKSIYYTLDIMGLRGTPDPWVVHIKAGTYDADPAKPVNERELFPIELRDGITLQGDNGPDACVISGQFNPSSTVPLLHGEDLSRITIWGLTLRDMTRSGGTDNGGALEALNCTGVIERCVFNNNEAHNGGGMWLGRTYSWYSMEFDIVDNIFSGNNSTYPGGGSGPGGGGFYVAACLTGNISGNTFIANGSHCNGGGFYVSALTGNISGNTFSGNSVSGLRGGGFDVNGALEGDLLDNTFCNNCSEYEGGAFYVAASLTGDVAGNVFARNSANRYPGGAVYVSGSLTGNVIGNVFTENSCTGNSAGGLSIGTLNGRISGNIFSGNSTVSTGGAAYLRGVAGDPYNAIISNNLFLYNNINATQELAGAGCYTNQNAFFVNNTFVGSDADESVLNIPSQASNSVIRNNIFCSVHTAIWEEGTLNIPIVCNDFNAVTDVIFSNNQARGHDLAYLEALLSELRNNEDWPPQLRGEAIDTGTWSQNGVYEAGTNQTTATDSSKNWTPGQWAGALLNASDAPGGHRRFYIADNTATTLVMRGNLVVTGYVVSEGGYSIDDYHLLPDSQNINAASSEAPVPEDDFEGNARPFGAAPDIGADEYVPPPPEPPVITTDGGNGPGTDYATRDEFLILEGTCQLGVQEIQVNGSNAGVVFTPGGTAWSYGATLQEGPNVFSVAAIDDIGYPSAATTITVALDTTPPDPPVIATNSGQDMLTNQPSIGLEGTCDADTNEIRVNGSTIGVAYTTGMMNWSYSGTLSEGPNAFAVVAADALDNVSGLASMTVTLDTVRPWVSSGVALSSTKVRVAFSEVMADTPGLVNPVFYTFTGEGAQLLASGVVRNAAFAVDITVNKMTSAGDYTVSVATASPTDLAGNHVDPAANSADFVGWVGLDPPVITTNGGGDFSTTDTEVTLEGTCAPDTHEIRVNDSTEGVTYTPGNTAWSYLGALAEGQNEFFVVARDVGENQTPPDVIRVTRLMASTILCFASTTELTLGEEVTLSGAISRTDGSGTVVSFVSTSPSGVEDADYPEAVAIGGTTYSRAFCPREASEGRPDWSVVASWPGDSLYQGAESGPATFEVLKAEPGLSVALNVTSVPLGFEELEVTVSLTAALPDELKGLLAGRPLKLYMKKPDGSSPAGLPITKNTAGNGRALFVAADFATAGIAFDAPGTWQFLAEFEEDDNFRHATSTAYDQPESVRLTVKDRAGYAVLVLGKLNALGEGHAEHAKALDFIYRAFRDRGFAEEDLYYLREGPESPAPDIHVDDTTPTQADVQTAITSWALDKMNASAAPLYVVFLDHGSDGEFYIYAGAYDETAVITPSELAGWFDALESGLDAEALAQDRVFLYGGCHSGSFVPAVSAEGRTVIASCRADEVSHRGVIDPEDGLRSGEVFLTEFFREARDGKTFKDSFDVASERVVEYTLSKSSNGLGVETQHPVLDDNGDGDGTCAPLSYLPGFDGAVSHGLTLGYGVNAGGSVSWAAVSPTLTLASGDPVGVLEAKATEAPAAGHTAWVEVKTPAYAGSTVADPTNPDSQQVVGVPTFAFEPGISDLANGFFRWETFGNAFDAPGTYQVFYYVQDADTQEVSSYMLTTIYRESPENQPPSAVTLVLPHEGFTVRHSAFFAWSGSVDPDGDPVTYRLELAQDAAFTTGLIVREGLMRRTAVIEYSDGLEDYTQYHWRVIPVDAYGASPAENPVRTFEVDFDNSDVLDGWVRGRVTDAATGEGVAGATVSVPLVPLSTASDDFGDYFFEATARTAYAVNVTADGYVARSLDVSVIEGMVAEFDVCLTPVSACHSADANEDWQISATEIGRVVGFYNAGAYCVNGGTVDGYAPGAGSHEGAAHDSDYVPQNWVISAPELGRLVTFYNAGGYVEDSGTADGFAPILKGE